MIFENQTGKITAYWVSSNFATCLVEVNENGIIIKTSPIWKKFTGQKFDNLKKWLKNKGLKIAILS